MINKDDDLLSVEALNWLIEMGYAKADHETRMKLIQMAKENF